MNVEQARQAIKNTTWKIGNILKRWRKNQCYRDGLFK